MVLKNYVCSDIHDDIEALATFADYVQAQEADNILVLGDFSLRPYTIKDLEKLVQNQTQPGVENFIKNKRTHNEKVLKEMKTILENTGIPYQVVSGNYDSSLESIFRDKELHLKSTKLSEAKVTGYGGADAFPPHIQLLVQLGQIVPFDHNELYCLLSKEKPDIVMTHNPPRGLCDDMFNGNNTGTPAITKYIMEQSPKLILSGHIHEAGPLGNNPNNTKGIASYKNPETEKITVAINPGNLGRFELVDPNTLQTYREFDYGTFVQVNTEKDGTPKKVIQFSVKDLGRKIGQVQKLEDYIL